MSCGSSSRKAFFLATNSPCQIPLLFWSRASSTSTRVLELILFLEERYQITLADEEIVPENLDSIQSLKIFVESKLNGLHCNGISPRRESTDVCAIRRDPVAA